MSCGCSDNNNNQDKKDFDRININTPPCNSDAAVESGCFSTKGLLYDKTTSDFAVPNVGQYTYIEVCEASRWQVGQFIAVNLDDNKIAAFKILKRFSKKLQVLNGCDKTGENAIFGNPEPGYIIPTDSLIYPIPPTGCESDLTDRIITTLSQYGAEAVRDLLAEQESLCFTSVPEVAEDEEVHLFGGTKPDCDCAPETFISSCFRKILNIATGQSGRTLCFPEILQTNTNPIDTVPKNLALFMPETNCLARGPSPQEFLQCSTNPEADEDEGVDAIICCDGGTNTNLMPDSIGSVLKVQETEESPGVWQKKWVQRKQGYAIVNYTTTGNGGTTTNGDWRVRALNTISAQSGDFVKLVSSVIEILVPGVYQMEFNCTFLRTNDAQARMINTEDLGEVYHGTSVYSNLHASVNSIGRAVITVAPGTTKKFRMEYRTELTEADRGLGQAPNFGTSTTITYAGVSIIEL